MRSEVVGAFLPLFRVVAGLQMEIIQLRALVAQETPIRYIVYCCVCQNRPADYVSLGCSQACPICESCSRGPDPRGLRTTVCGHCQLPTVYMALRRCRPQPTVPVPPQGDSQNVKPDDKNLKKIVFFPILLLSHDTARYFLWIVRNVFLLVLRHHNYFL